MLGILGESYYYVNIGLIVGVVGVLESWFGFKDKKDECFKCFSVWKFILSGVYE